MFKGVYFPITYYKHWMESYKEHDQLSGNSSVQDMFLQCRCRYLKDTLSWIFWKIQIIF